MRRGGDSATFFMPFGLERPALVIEHHRVVAGRVEPAGPLAPGDRRRLVAALRGIDEPLLLVPLADLGKAPAGQPLAASAAWALIALDRAEDAAPALRDLARWRAGLSATALVTRELARFEALARAAHRPLRQRQGAPFVAAERDHAAHRPEPRAQPPRTATATA